MKGITIGLMQTVLLVLGCQTSVQTASPFFVGDEVTGVEIGSAQAWSVENGVLKCNGSHSDYAWLSTVRKYGDFKLTLQWRIGPEGNSGVFCRAPARQGRTSMKGFEVQCRDDTKDSTLEDVSGAVFRRIPAAGTYSKPIGQWNRMKITCVGRQLRIELNGHLVSDTDINAVVPRDNDPSMRNIPDEGYIGLQNHGTPVEFRNIRIQEPD